jgi:hypothetical protein
VGADVKLLLGVIDIPYADEPGTTTGDVATILEGKYQIMEKFYDRHGDDMADELADGFAGALENIMAGGPPNLPFQSGMPKTERAFRTFLDLEEIKGDGIPTQAALDGVSKRFKRNHGPRRPSFIDSGLYQASMKAWLES